jgi:ThiF family
MNTINADSMHRLAKIALDSGDATSPEEALSIFSRYRLRIHLGQGWADSLAGQACFLTALNTAVRAFLGGVEVYGDVNSVLLVPLYEGRVTTEVIYELGGVIAEHAEQDVPTVVLGHWSKADQPEFCIQLQWDAWCAAISPVGQRQSLSCEADNPLAGVAAAALGINEAFLHIRGDLPTAGHRTVGISLWSPLAVDDWAENKHRGPALEYLPSSLWIIGLGHLGQAYAWTLGMLPYARDNRPHLVLQDFDKVAKSNLSTCLLLSDKDIGQRKVRLVAQRLEAVGFTTDLVERRFGPAHHALAGEPTMALFGVDNIAARRDIDSADFSMVVEAGLGSGYRDFRNIRIHTFPGPKLASDIWSAADAAQKALELNDTYRKLADKNDDLCGITQLASRSVATPFVGVLAATLVLAEVIRPLHGGYIHATLDVPMKDLRHNVGAVLSVYRGRLTSFVPVTIPSIPEEATELFQAELALGE